MIVVPLGRPERENDVMAMWRAQTRRSELLLVRGTGSAGARRNEGLATARERGVEWVVFWDDDNYYGPRYLEDFERAAPEADVISRGLGFVRNGPALWDFSARKLGFFPGHSTAVRVSIALDMPDCTGGEEIPWSRSLVALGARVTWLPPTCLVYDRSAGDHGYDSTWPEFLMAFGPGVNLGEQPDAYADEPGGEVGTVETATEDAIFRSLEARMFRARGAI